MTSFLGVWIQEPEEFISAVEYTVTQDSAGLNVSALDSNDGENGQVSNIILNAEDLSFSVYWPSSGHRCQCRFVHVSPDEVKLHFTYSDTARLFRRI